MNNVLKIGFLYTAMGTYGNLIITLIINAILSRILTPTDYGVVSVVMVFVSFFQMLGDMGLGPAIIQNKNLKQSDIQDLFNFSFYFSLILTILFGVLSLVLGYVYNSDLIFQISLVLTIAVLFYSFVVVPNAVLLKNKEFKYINISKLIASTIGGLVSISLAFLGFNVFSLAAMYILMSIIQFFLLKRRSKLKLKANFKITTLKKVSEFAKNQFGFNFINYFSRNSDNLLIGKYFGQAELGYYSKAYQLTLYPTTLISGLFAPVLQPILSDYENDILYIKKVYFNIVKIIAWIAFPISIFCVFGAKEIIYIFFGNQWDLAIIPFQILASTTLWSSMIGSLSGAIFQSRNLTRILLFTGVINSSINILGIIIGIFFGNINFVASMVALASLVNFFISLGILNNKALDSNIFEFIKNIFRPLISSIGTSIILYIISYYLVIGNGNVWGTFILRFFIWGTVTIFLMSLTGGIKDIINFLKKS